MGLIDTITGGSGEDHDPEWGIVVRDHTEGKFAAPPGDIDSEELRWENQISKDEFKRVIEEEYGEELNPTHSYTHVPLSPPDSAEKWDMDRAVWTIEEEEEETEEAKELKKLRKEVRESKDTGSSMDVDLTDVDSERELQAKMKGVVLQQGIQNHAESMDDLLALMQVVDGGDSDGTDPMTTLLDNVDSNMEVNSLSDAALFMTLSQSQDEISGLLGKLNGALDSGSAMGALLGGGLGGGGSNGGGNHDTIELSKDEYRELVSGDGASNDDEPDDGNDDGFSMDNYTDDDGPEDVPEDGIEDGTIDEEDIDERYAADPDPEQDMTSDDHNPMTASPDDHDPAEIEEEA